MAIRTNPSNHLETSDKKGIIYANDVTHKYSYTLTFSHNKEKTEAFISGKQREEKILFKITSGSLSKYFSDDPILNLGETFPPRLMYLLENVTRSQTNTKDDDFYSIGIVRQSEGLGKKDIKQHFKDTFTSALMKKTLPKRIVARILINNDHWQLLILDLQKGIQNLELYIINTTNKTKDMSLEEIQEEYFYLIGESLNEIFSELGIKKRIKSSEIKYIQGLQYGEAGCAFTTDLNFQRLLLECSANFEKSYFKEEDIIFSEIVKQIPIHHDEEGRVEHLQQKERVLDKEKSVDRSHRYTLVDETVRRIIFFIEFLKKQNLKTELLFFDLSSLRKVKK